MRKQAVTIRHGNLPKSFRKCCAKEVREQSLAAMVDRKVNACNHAVVVRTRNPVSQGPCCNASWIGIDHNSSWFHDPSERQMPSRQLGFRSRVGTTSAIFPSFCRKTQGGIHLKPAVVNRPRRGYLRPRLLGTAIAFFPPSITTPVSNDSPKMTLLFDKGSLSRAAYALN